MRLNQEYPAHGPWRFVINRLVADADEAVTEVLVTDGAETFTVISFFVVERDKIARMVEFWPDPSPGPANRAHLVETM